MSASKSEKLKDHIAPLLSAMRDFSDPVSYTHLRAHETDVDLV